MDFITKKAFESKLNKVGKELGLKSDNKNIFGGASSSNKESPFAFLQRNENADAERDVESAPETFSSRNANIFDSKPKNFPFLIHIFYVDRSILSESARIPVTWAFRSLCLMEILLVFNSASNILSTILKKGDDWIFLLLSVVASILLSVYQLFAYETAFRGAYRTSRNLKKRYLYMFTPNIIISAIYACLGIGWLNGWMRIRSIVNDEFENEAVRETVTIVEALGWMVLMFVSVYTVFEYYHLYQSDQEGLSPSAIESANYSDRAEQETTQPTRQNNQDTNRGRRPDVQAIRDKYSNPR